MPQIKDPKSRGPITCIKEGSVQGIFFNVWMNSKNKPKGISLAYVTFEYY